uniref:TMV resistance protein N n=1 Tax=Cajanus cajan TaxID=3821 RepID=A0A151R1W7_CAJCA|nr:TMV resistance protein N [Cajanus cajan]
MEFASSSPSFSESKPKWKYDVFISSGGGDICRAFVSHLHSALLEAKVNTFLEDENEHKNEVMRAIEGSQIAIVVFSKSYAVPTWGQSIWCLEELEKIIECHETVMPIFYEIDPYDERHQKGDLVKALKAAEQEMFSGELLEIRLSRWSRSLSKVANFRRWVQSDFTNEAELVREVVDHILTKLDNEVLPITKFPVGLESRVEKVIGFIEKQSNKVCIIGIWGMGGSGKTTTAKAIYNQIHRTFMDKSFIEDIREVCKTKGRGHVRLQERLLSDILKGKVKIQSIGKGTTIIKERLCGKKLLIVLDNVNEMSQLHLCGNREWFGQGTVIIITTRNLRLLDRFKVDYLYEMHKMDEKESLELFSWHAFGEAKPREDFNEFARNIVAYCGGLPLALQVLGYYSFGQTSKEVWESLSSNPKITPFDQILEKLRISFDDLQDQMEKDIFLDICCFFIGVDRAYVTNILNGCGLYADIGITVLIECSLIKLEKNNKLGMHPLLQEMGREIICESSRTELGKRSRLWFEGDVLYVLEKNTGTKAIEGLALKLHLSNRYFFIKADAFKKMKNLRLLQLDNVQLTGDYGCLSKQLRWIRWKGFPRRYIPNNFYLEGAIAIDLKHSNLRLVWKDPQDLGWLKILNLSHSKYLKETPEFSKLPNLEKLILKDCPSLCKVHKSIGDLRNLILLNLKDCKSLANLPRRVYKLKSVKSLILSGSSKIDKLEEDIVQMESLTTLFAKNTAVTRVPFSIVRSKSIDYVSLCGYEGLSHNVFPSIIWSWMSPKMNPLTRIHSFSVTSSYLVYMDLQNNILGDLASAVRNLSNLRSLSVQDTEFQLSKLLRTIPDDAYGVNFTEFEIRSDTSQISNQYQGSYLIGIGCYRAVFNTLIDSISKVHSLHFCLLTFTIHSSY